MDYDEIKPFMNPSMITVLEVHPKVKRKELLEGIEFIRKTILENKNCKLQIVVRFVSGRAIFA